MAKTRKKSPLTLLLNRNTLAGLLSVAFVIVYVADLGFEGERLRPTTTGNDLANNTQGSSAEKIANGIQSLHFDEQGQVSHRFYSERAEYYLQAKGSGTSAYSEDLFDEGELLFSELDSQRKFTVKSHAPRFRLFEQGELVAEIESEMAIGNARNNRTELIGNVVLTHHAQQSELRTPRLMLDPESRQVLTREAVTLQGPHYHTSALGLQGNLTDQRWQLLSDVKTRIQPK